MPLTDDERFARLSPFAQEIVKDCGSLASPADVLRTVATYAGDEYGLLAATIIELDNYSHA
jgi:hypothetical protein